LNDANHQRYRKMLVTQVFSQSLRQVIDFVHCGVKYHASFSKQSLFSTLGNPCQLQLLGTLLGRVDCDGT
jgi:hypothetical protein